MKLPLNAEYLFEIDTAQNPTTPQYEDMRGTLTDFTETTEEQTEEKFYLSNGGAATVVSLGTTFSYEFSGDRDLDDPAQNFIAALKKSSDAKITTFRVTEADGSTLTGLATISNIVTSGGAANEVAEFSCTITFNGIPTFTAPTYVPV